MFLQYCVYFHWNIKTTYSCEENARSKSQWKSIAQLYTYMIAVCMLNLKNRISHILLRYSNWIVYYYPYYILVQLSGHMIFSDFVYAVCIRGVGRELKSLWPARSRELPGSDFVQLCFSLFCGLVCFGLLCIYIYLHPARCSWMV